MTESDDNVNYEMAYIRACFELDEVSAKYIKLRDAARRVCQKKRLAEKAGERRAANFAKMKKTEGFKSFVRRHEGQTELADNKYLRDDAIDELWQLVRPDS